MVTSAAVVKQPRTVYLASLLWLSLVAALIGNIQPVFLGALAETFGLSGRQLGFVGGAELGGSCLASLTAIYWFQRAQIRTLAVFAIAVAAVGNIMSTWAVDYSALLLARFTIGFLGSGVLYAFTLGLIGQLENPDRLIAIAIVTQVVSLAIGMACVPLLMARWGLMGVTCTLALLFLTALICVPLLPMRARAERVLSKESGRLAFLPLGLLLSLIIFCVGLGAVWPFIERMGNSAGFSMVEVGNALALSGLLGGLGAGVAALLGLRLGRLLPVTIAITLGLLAGFILATRSDWASYIIAIALFNFAWNLTFPYLMGAIAAADISGRFMVLIPAAQTGGYATGPVLVGLFLVDDGYQVAAKISMMLFIVCLLISLPLLRKVGQSGENSTPAQN